MICKKLAARIVGPCLLGLALVGTANAACTVDLAAFRSASESTREPPSQYGFTSAVFHPQSGSDAHLIPIAAHSSSTPSIVGMWRFQFSKSLGGDFGTVIWHGDGTEVMISAARDPAAGDVCMGAWKQTGPYTYELNHIAMGHDGPPGGPPSPTFTNTVHLHEYIKLAASGDRYSGTIHAVISAANPDRPFDESNVIAQVNGTISATRVNP